MVHSKGAAAAFSAITSTHVVVGAVAPTDTGLWVATEGIGPGEMEGVVTDETGTPIPGVCVDLYGEEEGSYTSTVTSSTGWNHVGRLANDDYRISFEEDCVGGAFVGEWYEDMPTEETADAVTVTNDTTIRADAELAAASSITGTVTDVDGGGALAGICVTAYNADGTAYGATWATVTGSYRTSVTGYYRVGGLRPGDYQVEFWDCNPTPLYLTEWWDDEPSFFDADTITVGEEESVEDIDPELAMGASFEGVVRDIENAPLSGACVDTYDDDGFWVGTAYTSSTGYYRLGALDGGSYRARFQDCLLDLYAYQWWDDEDDYGSADPIVLADGERRSDSVDARFGYGGTIQGVVKRGATSLSDVCVDVYDSAGDYVAGTITTNTGWYRIPTLRTSSYKVFAEDCGDQNYGEEWYQDKDNFSSATPVAVTAGSETTAHVNLGSEPGAPTGVTASAGDGSASVSWSAPASVGS